MINFLTMAGVAAVVALCAGTAVDWHRLSGGDWRRTHLGRHVMTFIVAVGWLALVVLAGMILRRHLHYLPGWYQAVRLLSVWALAVGVAERWLIVRTAQQHGRPSRTEPPTT